MSRKKVLPLRRADFKIYQHKNQIKIETPQNKENAFSKIVLDIFLPIQNYMKRCQLKKSLDPTLQVPLRTEQHTCSPLL